mgnify:CR=1 FL=1
MILLRVLKQLESVYSVMKLENYTKLLSELHFDRWWRRVSRASCTSVWTT